MSSFSFFFFYHLFIARENLDKTRRVFVISLSFFRKIKIWNIENIRGNIVSWIFEGRKRGWFGNCNSQFRGTFTDDPTVKFIVLEGRDKDLFDDRETEETLSRWAFQEIARNLYAFGIRIAAGW